LIILYENVKWILIVNVYNKHTIGPIARTYLTEKSKNSFCQNQFYSEQNNNWNSKKLPNTHVSLQSLLSTKNVIYRVFQTG